MSMIFVLIEIKFKIYINNDELLIIIWQHNKKENRHWYFDLIILKILQPKATKKNQVPTQHRWNPKKEGKRKKVLSLVCQLSNLFKKVMLNSNQHVFWVNFCMLVIK